ncbi:MAG TPA: TolC family protein [Gemmatimonadaceae bacterium]|nr:TolC family protein [Gemmatimonadaceae bacterium]
MLYRDNILRTLLIATVIVAGCGRPPRVNGAAGASPSPSVPWQPPANAVKAEPLVPPAQLAAIPPDLAERVRQLTISDVVDIALRNNPATRASWSQARAAAFTFGSERGQYYPTVSATTNVGRSQTPATTTRPAGRTTSYGPSVSLSYLVLDFGGRSGSIERARQELFAANLTHNSTIQNVVLQAEVAYFTYMATASLLAAERSALAEAQANLNAAQGRNRVGLATIADVLQAKTALSQEQLNLETIQGNLQAARGALAAALGLPANLPFDLQPLTEPLPVRALALSVDSVISEALRSRPDLQAARAQAEAAAQSVRVAKSAELPSLSLNSTAGRSFSNPQLFAGPSYNIQLGLSIPIFNGFSHQYDVAAARAQADAVAAIADQTRQTVVTQVFVSYYALQTAAQRVATADDLLASAQQSAQVAAGRYREGVGSIIDLLTAQTALANARAQQVQARWEWYTSLAQLARDAGVLSVHGDTPFVFSTDSTVPRPLPNPATP